MSASLKWVRRNYNVPAFTGLEVAYRGAPATILGGRAQYVRVLPQGAKRAAIVHPYDITYPVLPLPPRPRGWCDHCMEERAIRADGTVVRHQRNGHERFPPDERNCPGAGRKPWGICAWTIAPPATTEEEAAA
ncbi:hypothetical protein OG552_10215 [Streptomyces sp. NBC_01476]|uniref:hypothetical protein n=1 Tax=Streptomyces sp. NBC_01476 TaxID=2903881 RepID=UPI002E3526C3|nr:hypothetical protein [Streptomyces sp. NBC_01476]